MSRQFSSRFLFSKWKNAEASHVISRGVKFVNYKNEYGLAEMTLID